MNRLVLVNVDILNEYLETFHIEDEEFYKQIEKNMKEFALIYLTLCLT